MRYLLVVLLLSISSNLYADDSTYNFEAEEEHQEKLFKVSTGEAIDLHKYTVFGGVESLPFYPIIKIDFFKVFDKSYYEDKTFTYVVPNESHENSPGFGVRLRMSAGWSK
jgi:hypothetical protein